MCIKDPRQGPPIVMPLRFFIVDFMLFVFDKIIKGKSGVVSKFSKKNMTKPLAEESGRKLA